MELNDFDIIALKKIDSSNILVNTSSDRWNLEQFPLYKTTCDSVSLYTFYLWKISSLQQNYFLYLIISIINGLFG